MSSGTRFDQRRERGASRRVSVGLLASTLGAVGFAAAYVEGANTQLSGIALAVAFGGLAAALTGWARNLLPTGGFVEEHEPFASPPRERKLAAQALAGPESPVRRSGLIALLGLALGTIGTALLFPVRSFLPPRRPDPVTALRRTAWRAGVRMVTEDGRPVRLSDVAAESVLIVFPEGDTKSADAPAFLVRLDPGRQRVPPPGGQVQGVVAYSLICTHAGCPVGLYVQGTATMLCPCHQSAFDLLAAGRPVAGPAARPLPGLPFEVGPDGVLIARSDFTSPPGPGFWSRQ